MVIEAFISGTKMPNKVKNAPLVRNPEILLPAKSPISSIKRLRIPLKRLSLNGATPAYCLSDITKPMIKLSKMIKTEPLVKASCKTLFNLLRPFFWLAKRPMRITPTIIAGDSIIARAAIICPPKGVPDSCRKDTAVTKVTALTEP